MLIITLYNDLFIKQIILNNNFLIFITFLTCYLLNSRIKLINLKFNDFKFKGVNKYRILLIISSSILIVVLGWLAIPVILFLYYILSYFALRLSKKVN